MQTVSLHPTQKNPTTVIYGGVRRRSLRKEAASKSDDTTADTSVSLARWQQGEQAVACVGIVF